MSEQPVQPRDADIVEPVGGDAVGGEGEVGLIGDRGVRETLDLYERAWETMGVEGNDLRWRVEHAQHIDPIDVPRFGELGVIASENLSDRFEEWRWTPAELNEGFSYDGLPDEARQESEYYTSLALDAPGEYAAFREAVQLGARDIDGEIRFQPAAKGKLALSPQGG